MRTTLLLPAILVIALQLAAQSDEALDFRRRQRPGTSYSARIRGEYLVLCRIEGTASGRNVENRMIFEFDGDLAILECNADGAPTAILLSPRSISGSINDKGGFFSQGYGRFRLKWDDQRMLVESEEENFKASSLEIGLLSIVFRPPSSQARLEDVLGEGRAFRLGDEWNPPKDYLRKIFSSRGFSVKDENISQKARFEGRSTESAGECAIITAKMSVGGIDGFDFEYSAEIVLPFDAGAVPVRTKSRAVEKILKKRSNVSDPALVGEDFSEMLITITHLMEVSLTAKED